MKDRSARTVKKRSLDEDGGENTNEEIVGEDKKDDDLKAQRRSAREESKVNFVGSISFHFKDKIVELCEAYGFELGDVIKQPMSGLAKYHKEKLIGNI